MNDARPDDARPDDARPDDARSRTGLSTDALFELLADANRRTILFHLRQHGAATVDELVDVLVDVGEYDADHAGRRAVVTSLRHVDLPKLEERGLVSYDRETLVVEAAAVPAEVGEWLDLAVRRDIQFAPGRERAGRAPDDEPRPIRVLLVDDEPGLPETIASYVERENDDVEVTTAWRVLEAVSKLDEEPFDCIVSDYQMPALSGLDFLKAVREQDPEIPFIVFTAKGSEATASEAIATDVTDYVRKRPDTDQYDELVERIRKALDRD
jgi:CheY-like chemotaxis protein/DNA-binding transcriptional ArsR family regulator